VVATTDTTDTAASTEAAALAATPLEVAEPAAVPPAPDPEAMLVPARVYSALDEDVTAPIPLYSQRFNNLTAALQPNDAVTIEYIVNDQGRVAVARAKARPRTIGESLLLVTGLHAVKTWHFQPALKDGSPVAFRDLVTFGGY
jgi:hypothetical protein